MELCDLINKSVSEMTTEELEESIMILKNMKIIKTEDGSIQTKVKSNKHKQIESMVSKLTPEQKKALSALLSK